MKVFIQPESAEEQAALLSTELVITTSSGDHYVLKKGISTKQHSSGARIIPYYSDQPIEREDPLKQFQQVVEATLAAHKRLFYALYKELSASDLSYYILLENNTFELQQTILSALYAWPIDDLRRHTTLPVYYHFFPKEQEALLKDTQAIKPLQLYA